MRIPDSERLEPLKSATKTALLYSGVYRLRRTLAARARPGHRLIVLVYHNFDDIDRANGRRHHFDIRPQLSASAFAAQMRILKKTYPVVSLEDGVHALQTNQLSCDCVAITFDDAYRSFLTVAHPVLKELDLPATMFVPTDYIESGRLFWWDELNQVLFWLMQYPDSAGDLESILGLRLARQLAASTSDDERMSAFRDTLEGQLRYREATQRAEIILGLRHRLPREGQDGIRPEPLLSWAEMNSLRRERVDFQSHTCSHFGFADVGADQIREELHRSREVISSLVGHPVTMLAYPYGGDRASYAKSLDLIRSCGYTAARTTNLGFNDSRSELLLLKAAGIGATSSEAIVRRDLALGFLRT